MMLFINLFYRLDLKKPPIQRLPGDNWSGQATRSQGFAVEETRVDVSIGEPGPEQKTTVRKERPVWMTESTVVTDRMVIAKNLPIC